MFFPLVLAIKFNIKCSKNKIHCWYFLMLFVCTGSVVEGIGFGCFHVAGGFERWSEPGGMDPGRWGWWSWWVDCWRGQCGTRRSSSEIVMSSCGCVRGTEESTTGSVHHFIKWILTVTVTLIAGRSWCSRWRWRRVERWHFRRVTSSWASPVKAATRRWWWWKDFFVSGRDGRWKRVVELLLKHQLMLQVLFLLLQQKSVRHLLPEVREVVVVIGWCFGSRGGFGARWWRKCRLGTRGWDG